MRLQKIPYGKSVVVAGLASFLLAATPPVQQASPPKQPGDERQSPQIADTQIPDLFPILQQFQVDSTQRMTVPVRINGSEPYEFVVDTGAERTVVSRELGEILSLGSGPRLKLATVSGPATVDSFRVDRLTMSDIGVNDIEAPVLKRNNLGAYGLLGIDSLEKHKVLIDFENAEMAIEPAKKRRRQNSQLSGDVIVVNARRRAGRLVLTNAKIGTMRVDIVIDTGAQITMGNAALRKRLRRYQRRGDYVKVGIKTVIGDSISGDFTQIRQIEIGGLTINDLPITFTSNYAFKALNLERRPAMLLGMDAMRLFDKVEIDFANKQVVFNLPRESEIQRRGRLASNESRMLSMSLPSPVTSRP